MGDGGGGGGGVIPKDLQFCFLQNDTQMLLLYYSNNYDGTSLLMVLNIAL